MSTKISELTARPIERAFLVGVDIIQEQKLLTTEDSLAELALLAKTAGLDVVGKEIQKLKRPNAKTLIGSGKVDQLKIVTEELAVDVLIFDDELSPRHQRELEKIFTNVRILDRTAVILDIFAQHASTKEGSLQVELAQYEYRLPRLTRAWTHLARQAGGGGGRSGSVGGVGLRGPGETQLEIDRREINRRISHLKEQLEKVRTHRQQYRTRRKQSQIPVISLVGYTNAGKSTLLNTISNAGVYVANQLFATLDPTTRRIELPGGSYTLLTDTVGFIQKLPTDLVAAFRATLEEISESDLLIHVIDITHVNVISQVESVHQTLVDIGADSLPIISALNKIDLLQDPKQAQDILRLFPNATAISALTGEGLGELFQLINDQLFRSLVPIEVIIPYINGNLISLFHEEGIVDNLKNLRTGVQIKGKLPKRWIASYQPFLKKQFQNI